MGQKTAKHLPREDMEFLLTNTSFSREQIEDWYKGYRKDCPNGLLSRKKFLDVYSTFFPDGKAKKFYAHVFRTFDQDNSGKIDFKEFLQAINITQCGSPKNKLELAFRLYDIDASGTIEQSEMEEIMKAIYLMGGGGGGGGSKNVLTETPVDRTKEIFNKMDKKKNGFLTKEEFINGCLEDEELFRMLTCTSELQPPDEAGPAEEGGGGPSSSPPFLLIPYHQGPFHTLRDHSLGF